MNLNEFKPKDKGILTPDEPAKKERLGSQVGVRFTRSEKVKLQKIADDEGIGKLATIIRSLLRKHGYI